MLLVAGSERDSLPYHGESLGKAVTDRRLNAEPVHTHLTQCGYTVKLSGTRAA